MALLSEDSIRRRQRRNTIGIQITVFSWMLEFLAGSIFCARYWVPLFYSNENFYRIRMLLDNSVCFVLIPSSYLLNNEDVKLSIQATGWRALFRIYGIEESDPENGTN